MKRQWLIALLCIMFLYGGKVAGRTSTSQVRAFEETPRMAMVGALAGGFLGLHHYGLSRHMNPEHIWVNGVYGLAGGALLGAGMDVYEFGSRRPLEYDHVLNCVGIGALGGAFVGCFYAVIPWALEENNEDNFYQASIGLGLGGLIGAGIGLTVGVFTLPIDEGDSSGFEGSLGLKPETRLLNVTSEPRNLLWCARVVDISF